MHLKTFGLGLTALTLAGSAFTVAPAQAASLPTCSYKHLTAKIADSEGAAGSRYLTLQFKNTGGSTCALLGHPGVSFVKGDDGHQVGPSAAKANDKNVVVRLAPGQKADAVLRIVNAQNFPTGTCKPTSVRGLRVYAPGATKSFYLPLSTTACKQKTTMTINAVRHH